MARKLLHIFATLCLCFYVFAAHALEFNKLLDKSRIGFVYRQMNVPMEGNFTKFSSVVLFDPANPGASSARFEIDLASIDTGASDADEEVQGKLWFNTKVFPKAQFVSSSIKTVKPGRFDVAGKLSIKGRTRDVVVPVDFRQEGTNGLFEGVITIRRADFGIGEGVWADFGTVANDVQIKFSLLAASTLKK